jgi:hypothetical protein
MSIAIVTGASSGMGEEFCRRLDLLGLDCIWFVARRQDRLDQTASALKTPSRTFSVDLSDREQLDSFSSLISSEKPSIEYLVNCAGFGRFGMSWEIPAEVTRSMIDLNVTALVTLSEACVPFMADGGHIIELCSASAYIPLYDLNVYASTKAFVRHYCGGLRNELKGRNVSVTEVSPCWVKTDFIDKSVSDSSVPPKVFKGAVRKEDVVDQALKAAMKGKRRSVCGFSNKCIVSISTHFPNMAGKLWMRRFNRWHFCFLI